MNTLNTDSAGLSGAVMVEAWIRMGIERRDTLIAIPLEVSERSQHKLLPDPLDEERLENYVLDWLWTQFGWGWMGCGYERDFTFMDGAESGHLHVTTVSSIPNTRSIRVPRDHSNPDPDSFSPPPEGRAQINAQAASWDLGEPDPGPGSIRWITAWIQMGSERRNTVIEFPPDLYERGGHPLDTEPLTEIQLEDAVIDWIWSQFGWGWAGGGHENNFGFMEGYDSGSLVVTRLSSIPNTIRSRVP